MKLRFGGGPCSGAANSYGEGAGYGYHYWDGRKDGSGIGEGTCCSPGFRDGFDMGESGLHGFGDRWGSGGDFPYPVEGDGEGSACGARVRMGHR